MFSGFGKSGLSLRLISESMYIEVSKLAVFPHMVLCASRVLCPFLGTKLYYKISFSRFYWQWNGPGDDMTALTCAHTAL